MKYEIIKDKQRKGRTSIVVYSYQNIRIVAYGMESGYFEKENVEPVFV